MAKAGRGPGGDSPIVKQSPAGGDNNERGEPVTKQLQTQLRARFESCVHDSELARALLTF
jgi:hypothetical protein